MKIILALVLQSILFQFAFAQDKINKNEELVVLSCSGEESGVSFLTMRSYTKEFKNNVIKIVKLKGVIVKVILNDEVLTKEKRATNPESPTFLRWFEKTADGIITYGQSSTSNKEPKWNIKLSSQGVFEREGIALTQKGTCSVQQKAF
jgi:hypothetical protein